MPANEDIITSWFAARSAASKEQFPIGIGDDMAQVAIPAAGSVLITTDMLLEGTHFDLSKTTITQIGYKAVSVSLSDCAAMATKPICCVVAVALPKGFESEKLKQLHAGIVRAAEPFGCTLIGGDITCWSDSSAHLAINVSMLSTPADNTPVTRAGAKPGDLICVTGSLGGSIHGKHLTFTPRVNEALAIAGAAKITAMIDITDGLSTDLNRICNRSGVGALIDGSKIPVSQDAKKVSDPFFSALHDGEDFELLFTLSGEDCKKLIQTWELTTPITQIGSITEPTDAGGLRIIMPNGKTTTLAPGGYDHL